MKTYTQTKNKFVLSIMFMAFVLFAVSGIFLLRHNTTSVRADGEQNFTYTYGNETTVKDNVTYSWSILDAQNKTAKLYKVTMDEGANSNLVLPSKINRAGEEAPYTFVEMYSSSTNNQNGVFYPSKDKITSIAFADDNQITNIGANAFYGCANLTNVTIPSTITNIGVNAFAGCSSIQTISYDANLTNSFTLGNGIFAGSGNALNLNILSNVTSIPAYAFSGMTNITNLVFHKDTQVTSFGEGAFMNANLKNATIPATVNSIGKWAFAGNPQLAISVANGNTNFAVSESCLYKLTDSKKTTLLAIPSSATSLTIDAECTEINAEVFYGCTNLTTITANANFAFENNCLYKLVDGKKQILVYVTANATEFSPNAECTEYAANAFINAKALTTLTINADIANQAYANVNTITEVVIQEGVTTIGAGAFYNCVNLKKVTIPSTITSIGGSAFLGCVNLETVEYNATNPTINATIVSVSRVFENAGTNVEAGLTFNVGANVTHIPAGLFTVYDSTYSPKLTAVNFAEGSQLTTIGDSAFYLVSTLTNINFPSTLTTIGAQSFEGTSITSATFPATVTSIGNKAFYLCDDLTKVEFTYTEGSNNITIGSQAFMGTGVQELTLSNKVTSIGADAFKDCGNLAKVVFTNASMSDPQVTIGAGAFKGNKADVKYYFYDHTYTLSDTIFTNTTNNNIYIIKIYNGEELVKTYNAPAGEVITLPTNNDIKKEGYGLVGWSTLADADSGVFEYTVVAETDKVKNILYAVWQERFTITFDMQEGTAGTDSVQATFNLAVPTITLPTREGYRFGGYYTEANAQGIKYYNADGSSARNWDIYTNSTLYANWIKLYDITLNKDNGTGGTDKITYAIDDVLANIEVPTRTGYTFLGFYNGETQIFDATGAVVADIIKSGAEDRDNGTAFTFQNSEVTELTAEWQINNYTITFESGEGYTISAKLNGADFTSGSTITINDSLVFTITAANGYTAGSLSVNGTENTYTFDANTLSNVSGNVAISGSASINQYTLTIVNGANSTITVNKNGTPVETGAKITVKDELTFTITADTGYTADDVIVTGTDGAFTRTENTITGIYTDLTISAGDADENYYTVNFTSGTGYTISAKLNGSDFASGSSITINDSLVFTITAAKGYTAGSLTANGTENTYTFESNTLSNVSGNVTISGSATPTQYEITLESGTGYTITATLNEVPFTSGNTITIADSLVLTITASEGYTAGALVVSGTDAERTFNGTTLSNVNTAITVSGSATANTYAIVYNSNKPATATGTVTGTMASTDMTYNTPANLRDNAFMLTGYTFLGWATSADGSVVYENTQEVNNLTATQGATFNVYAIWEAITYKVEYHKVKPTSATTEISGETLANEGVVYDQEFTLRACNFTLTGYKFAGWSLIENGEIAYTDEQTISNLTATNDDIVELYSVFTPITYQIVFDTDNGNATDDVQGTMANYIATYDRTITLPACEYTLRGYTFLGWATTLNGAVVYNNTAEITTNLASTQDATITLYPVWEITSYTITYQNSNTCDIVITTSGGADFDSGSKLNVENAIIIKLTPKPGYALAQDITESIIINAYSTQYQLTAKDGTTNEFKLEQITSDLEISVVAFAKTDTAYRVEHYKQNLTTTEGAGDANYTLIDADTDNLTGTTDTNTQAVAKAYTGFEVKAFEQANINGDGSTIVKIYYDRIIYTVTFVIDESKGTTTDELVYELPYEATVTPPTVTSTHYDLLGWDTSVATIVTADATYTATFTPKLYSVNLAINDTTAGAIKDGHTLVPNVPYGTKITALGNVLTFHISGAPFTVEGVPTPTSASSATQYRLLNWYYNGTTPITQDGINLDVATATITAHFEKRIVYFTDTAGELDLSDSIGVAEKTGAKFDKVANDKVNTLIVVPAGKRAVQAYNINVYALDNNNELTNIVVPTSGEIFVKLNVADNVLLSTGLQVLILNESTGQVITRDATITGNQLTFTTSVLGQMVIIADVQATFLWWIIVLVVVVVLIVVAVLYWLLVLRPQEKVENDSDANEDYDSVLTGLAEDKRQKDAKVKDDAVKGKKIIKTETKTTQTTTTKTTKKPEDKKDK